jgi:L-alanine-DL-glutamate epimerase-like enolase superfamily enzyme
MSCSATLRDHRIARIETAAVQDRYPRMVGRNARLGRHGNGPGYQVRVLHTDRGAAGWGLAAGPDEAVRKFVGARVGDLFDPALGAADEAMALDLALHDLAGRVLGLAVHAMLGSAGPRAAPVYSGAIYFDDLDPEDNPRGIAAVLANCQQDYDAGHRAFKLKIGRGHKWMPAEAGLQRDIQVTRAVRERFPACKILVDANDGYTCDGFLRYLSAAADCELYWIEEPFAERREDLDKLRAHMHKVGCRALVADGEAARERPATPGRWGGYSEAHVEMLLQLARERLLDVLLMDITAVGFTRWRRMMPELTAAGALASPHTWGITLKTLYAAQLAAGLGNAAIVEGVPGRADRVDASSYILCEGRLAVPDAPGFGMGTLL